MTFARKIYDLSLTFIRELVKRDNHPLYTRQYDQLTQKLRKIEAEHPETQSCTTYHYAIGSSSDENYCQCSQEGCFLGRKIHDALTERLEEVEKET